MRNATRASYKFACALVLLCSFTSARAGTLPETAGLLPPETVLLVDISDFGRFKTQFEETNFYKLYKDPAMAGFVKDFEAKLREKIQGLDENDIFKTLYNADVLPQGKLAFALVLDERAVDANEPTALFITQWGETVDKIKELTEKNAQEAIEGGAHQKTEDYRGVGIKTIIAEGSSRLGYGFSSKLSYCFVDDCLMGCEDIDILKFVIAHIKGAGSPTLADDGDYSATIAAIGPYHNIDFYVNIKQIIKTAIAKDTAGKAQSIMTNLGLDNVTSAAGSIGVGRVPGTSWSGKAFVKIEGVKKGICKMLDIETAAFRAPRFIPASAYSLTFLNLNIRKAYSTLGNILTSFSPQYAAWMYMPLPTSDSPDEPGLKIKDDIIDHLGSQVVIAQSVSKPFSKDKMPTESLIALATNNRSALEKSLSLLHSKVIAPSNPDASRELLGHTIYLLSVPAMAFPTTGVTPMRPLQPLQRSRLQGPAGPAAPQMLKLAFTITNTHLLFGTEPTVERAIRTLSSAEDVPLAAKNWFNNAKSSIPSVAGLAGFQDNAASSELLWWMMKQGKRALWGSNISEGARSPSIKFGSQDLGKLVNFNLLPEFDAVRRYFGLSAFYGISRPAGFFFEFKYLKQ